MFKKTLISLAVASSLGLTGCFGGGSDSKNANPSPKYTDPAIDGKTWPIFNPATREIPTPTDLSFSGSLDGTFLIALNEDSPPPAVALDSLSGGSTIDPIILRTNGQLPDSAEDANLIPNQTVFLIPLQYASNDPVQGLSNQEPPTVDAAKAQNTNFKVDVIELVGADGTASSAIRIVPTEPLAPNTRYVIGVTKSVVDVNGEPIISDPVYSNFSSEDAGLISAALAPIRTLANRLWEPTIIGYASLASGGQISLEQDDIAVSYSMTTSNDVQVLKYLANKELWLKDQLETLVRVSTAKQVVGGALFAQGTNLVEQNPSPLSGFQKWDLNRDGAINALDFDTNRDGEFTAADFLWSSSNPADFGFEDVNAAVDFFVTNFQPSVALGNSALAGCDGLPTSDERFACTATALAGLIDTNVPAEINAAQPAQRAITFGSAVNAQQKSAVLSLITGSENVGITEGSITLPYYLGIPNSESGAAIQASGWTANTDFATALNSIDSFSDAGLVLPQGKKWTTGENAGEFISEVVNSRFPFPKQTGELEVPLLIMHPQGADLSAPGTINEVVIFQHGITTDRSAAMAFGSALIAAGLLNSQKIAVVAIDQPLHGVAPATRGDKVALSSTLLRTAEPTLNDAQIEQLTALILAGDANQLAAALNQTMTPTPQEIGEAQVLINTVDNAGSTIPGLSPVFTTPGVNPSGATERHFAWGSNPDFNLTLDAGPSNLPFAAMQFNPAADVEEPGASGDLFINLGNFLNGRDNLRQGTVDLLNLRASLSQIAAFDAADVSFVGHSLGTVNGNAFVVAANNSGNADLEVKSSHLMTPASGLVRMLENSPSFAPTILAGLQQSAGLTQADADLQSFFGVFQAAIDSVDPINFATDLQTSRTLFSQIDGDRTTINAASSIYLDGSGTQWEAGYLPFKAQIGNLTVDSLESPLAGSEPLAAWSTAVDFGSGFPALTRYAEGTHGTPVLPLGETVDADDINLAEFEFVFLKDRTLAQGGEELVSSANAQATFGGLVQQTLTMILGD